MAVNSIMAEYRFNGEKKCMRPFLTKTERMHEMYDLRKMRDIQVFVYNFVIIILLFKMIIKGSFAKKIL